MRAKDIMHPGAATIGEHETLTAAAKYMRDMGVGALPIVGEDRQLRGMLTDRDIVLKGVAAGRDLDSATAGALAQGRTYHVGAEASVEQVLAVMDQHQIRRLPVVDQHHLLGIISEADIARHLPEDEIAPFVKAICAP